MECEEVQDLRERLKVKLWQLTGKDLRTMEVFLTVTNKDEYEQERFIINNILEEFLERSGRPNILITQLSTAVNTHISLNLLHD